MAVEFNMVITDEGIDFAREATANGGNWHLIPKRFAISATAGELTESRDYTSMLSTWTTASLGSALNGTNKIQNNVVLKANASNVDRQIGEIYFIYTNESKEEFLFAIAQPNKELMFTPGIQQNFVFIFTLNHTNVQDIVEVNYTFSDDIDNHNLDVNAHPHLLARDGSRTATGVLQYESPKTFSSARDIVDKEYVDNIKQAVAEDLENVKSDVAETVDTTKTIWKSAFPDYSRGQVSIGSGWVATYNGWLRWEKTGGDRSTAHLWFNGAVVQDYYHYKYRNDSEYFYPFSKDDKITFDNSRSYVFRTKGDA